MASHRKINGKERNNCGHVRFEVFTAVTMKKAVFLDVAHLHGATSQKTVFFNCGHAHSY
jgi:hypothetical protein